MQATSDKTASANFTQTGKTINNVRGVAGNVTNGKAGYNPYYQGGRKDAFRSAEYTVDPADGTTLIYKQESVTVGTTIQTPTTFYSNNNATFGESYVPAYYNAWNATYQTVNTTFDKIDGLEKVVKTVYDPCPVGYTVTPGNAFYGFNTSNFTVDGDGRSYTSNGKTLYFPVVGCRIYNGRFFGTTHHWFATVGRSDATRYFAFTLTMIDGPRDNGSRNYAFVVRPVREFSED